MPQLLIKEGPGKGDIAELAGEGGVAEIDAVLAELYERRGQWDQAFEHRSRALAGARTSRKSFNNPKGIYLLPIDPIPRQGASCYHQIRRCSLVSRKTINQAKPNTGVIMRWIHIMTRTKTGHCPSCEAQGKANS